MRTVSCLVVVLSMGVTVLGSGCSSTPKAEDPQGATSGGATDTPTGPEPSTTAALDPGPATTPQSGGGLVKTTGADGQPDNSVPDDYTLVEGDCIQLGKKLGALWKKDLQASLSPKLTDKQRATAEENIDEGSSKKADDWSNGCIKSLVGKSVDPKALKCAFDAKDLKTFEKCLN